MIAFTAEYAGGDIRLDDAEIAEARWFDAEALPALPSSLSIARRLIDTTARRLVEQ
jgi:NAD+ diphosphatase